MEFEQDLLFERSSSGNFERHDQTIMIKYLEEYGDKPAKNCVQIRTTEIDRPISYRFDKPGDMEDFIYCFLKAYKRCLEKKIPNPGFRKMRLDHVMTRIGNTLHG